ncbi:PilN domain-containing protein [Exilibacterium tricleocarpae]|uniref:PilN domain-containing protein n=1 Tax=Exilibacterium tricleocarpae TaxID=2591008 RepID=A0A545T651_9GAMM|nr:PilN domain-containing protein [Exilibacterium tricleocarpae]TQV72655.1 PilN domain-containing protein [Exilibacterium tricleocarpae]
MAKINLLPWRDEFRQEKKKEFTTVFLGVCVFSALVAYLWINTVENSIESQNNRNTMLEQEIAALEEQVKEIQELKRRKAELIDRMRVIQDLQGTRPVIVRYFDELVRSVPDGVFITLLSRKGNVISIEGVSESNNRVSTLMRNLNSSDWFSAPNLNSVTLAPEFGEQSMQFKLTVNTAVPGGETEAESVAGGN